jgi:hypothetical protein
MGASRVPNRAVSLVGLLTAMLIATSLAIPQIAGATPDPPGNNGTIKVDDLPFDNAPGNEPHDGCTFQVDFYGFDKGDLFADVTFEAHPPTLPEGEFRVVKTDTVFIGEDDNSGGGSEAGLDASVTYTLDLTSITPSPEQGVHVKLTIHAPDGSSQGADTKYKVFWVTGCGSTGTTTTTTTGGTTTTTTGGTTTTTTTGGTTTTTAAGATTTTTAGAPSSSLGGATSSVPPTTPPGKGGGVMPFTGANSLPIAASGLLLLLIGAGVVLASRRLRTR